MLQRESHRCQLQLAVMAVAQVEVTRRPEADRGDNRFCAQRLLVVAVPSHAVTAVAIKIEQYAIEDDIELLCQPLPQCGQFGCPGAGFQR